MPTKTATRRTVPQNAPVEENLRDLGGRPPSMKTIVVEEIMDAHACVLDGREQFQCAMQAASQKLFSARTKREAVEALHEAAADGVAAFDIASAKLRKATHKAEFGEAA